MNPAPEPLDWHQRPAASEREVEMVQKTLKEKLAELDRSNPGLTTRALSIWHSLDDAERTTLEALMKGSVAKSASRRLVQLGLVVWLQDGPSGLWTLTTLGRRIAAELSSVADLI